MASFMRSRYLGGQPSLGSPVDNTYLWVNETGICVGMVGRKRAVTWDEVVAVDFADGQAAKAPGAILSGARGSVARTTVTVTTRTGEQLYQVDRQDAAAVRAAFLPFLAGRGLDRPSDGAGLSAELAKLGDLRRSGVLSEAEFAAAKARLLG